MNYVIKTASVLAMSAVFSTAWAQCPRNLTAEQMYDCIVAQSPTDDSPKTLEVRKDSKEAFAKGERTDKQAKASGSKQTDM